MFDAEQKLRTHQYRGQGHFDPRLETLLRPSFQVQPERTLNVGTGHRTPIGSSYQRRKDLFGGAFFLARVRRPRHENPAPAGRLPGALRRIRTDDREGVDGRLDPRMPVEIEMCLVGLTSGFEQRRRIFQKCHTEHMRTSLHRNADREVAVDVVVRGLIIL